MIAQRPKNPAIPGNPKDRTGAAGILRRAAAEIRKRYAGLEAEALAIFARIPTYALNDLRTPAVRYGVRPEDLAGIADELQATVDRWIAAGRSLDYVFWWDGYVEEAAQLGTAQSVSNLANLSTTYAGARSLAAVVYSEPYRNRAKIAKFRSYEHWTGLSADARTKLAQVIGQAVADGTNPTVARKAIQEALQVSKSRALVYAQSEIPGVLREARMAESAQAEEDLGVKTGLLWTSAFKPTTRPWHASRSGKVYTRAEVKTFYAQGGNRYNCFCGLTECLLDADGKPILTKKLQSTMANERKRWESTYRSRG